jgi:DNA-binding transcriptional MerR regulator
MEHVMRIGELAKRTGVSPALLRAWEQRYGLLRPTRSDGGYRLYSSADVARVRRTRALIGEGMSAAEAARLALAQSEPATAEPSPAVDQITAALTAALDDFDAAAAHAALDRLLASVSVEFALAEAVIPYLHELGERWADGTATVAQEHFASNLLRGRLLGLAIDWGSVGRSSALLACLPGEAHDLGLVIFGLLLARRGWRLTFLGADTPLETLGVSVRTLAPTAVVLSTVDAGRFREHAATIAGLAASALVAVAAPVDDEEIRATGAQPLLYDIAAAAEALSATALRWD